MSNVYPRFGALLVSHALLTSRYTRSTNQRLQLSAEAATQQPAFTEMEKKSNKVLEDPRPKITTGLKKHVKSKCINSKGIFAMGFLCSGSFPGGSQLELPLLLYHSIIKLFLFLESDIRDCAVGNLGLSLKEEETCLRVNVYVSREWQGAPVSSSPSS